MQDFRVIDLPERTTLDSSDYVMIDSAENGTNKYLLSRLAAETDAKIATAVGGVEAELDAAVEGIEEDITALQGDMETVETTLETKADKDGTYPDMAVGSVLGTNTVTDREPYFIRPSASIGDREFDTLVGGTLGWNQLCNGSSVTVESGHKYYMIKSGTASVGASDGTAITGLTSGTDIVIDLTIDFGSTIADYIYSLETANAGDGVAWVRKYLPNDYYAYCAPTLKHVSGVSAHVLTGFNQWDEVWEEGSINNSGENIIYPNVRSKNYIPILPNNTYYIKASAGLMLFWYDANKTFISKSNGGINNQTVTLPTNAVYLRFRTADSYGATYQNDICINLSDASKNGTYEPYVQHSYPIDSTWVGMGIPKLDSANKLYFDGDTYASDGTVTERYGIRAYQSGDESLADAITDGTNTVYKLTTPTTSSASPYTSPQICDPDGTEEYVTTGLVPVGHETEYVENLADKLTDIPDLPTTAGTYSLKVTVSGGVPSYSWVSA